MKERTIKIMPNGDVFGIYDDNFPLRDQGEMSVERASNVLWNEKKQKWFVHIKRSAGKTTRLQQGFTARTDAIAYEVEILKNLLQNPGIDLGKIFFAK